MWQRLRSWLKPPVETDQQARLRAWNSVPRNEGALVFVGDSHIELGQWAQWWPSLPVLNRGTGGDKIAGVRSRIDEVTRHKPCLVVLQCGINDLVDRISPSAVQREYEAVLCQLREDAPECQVSVQSLLPVHAIRWKELPLVEAHAYVLDLNAHVRELNSLLETTAQKQGASFLNLFPAFEHEGMLRLDCTLDGMHLNDSGYRLWREVLSRHHSSHFPTP